MKGHLAARTQASTAMRAILARFIAPVNVCTYDFPYTVGCYRGTPVSVRP